MLEEAVKECEEAVRLDPTSGRVHHRLACLNRRLGLVEDARKHLFLTGQTPDPVELQKLQAVERHLAKFGDARKIGDWKSALREADAAIAAGADSSLLLVASRAESLLHVCHLDEADSVLTRSPKFEDSFPFSTATKIFGMLSFSYFYIVRAQVDMALGRLFHAQVALKASHGEEVSNLKFGGEVEEVTGAEQFRAAVSLSGASVVYFMTSLNKQCTQIAPFVDALCTRYPSANFLKVDVDQSPAIAKAENVLIVPTFKIYKNGIRVKEMICPSQQVLEYSVRHYSL